MYKRVYVGVNGLTSISMGISRELLPGLDYHHLLRANNEVDAIALFLSHISEETKAKEFDVTLTLNQGVSICMVVEDSFNAHEFFRFLNTKITEEAVEKKHKITLTNFKETTNKTQESYTSLNIYDDSLTGKTVSSSNSVKGKTFRPHDNKVIICDEYSILPNGIFIDNKVMYNYQCFDSFEIGEAYVNDKGY